MSTSRFFAADNADVQAPVAAVTLTAVAPTPAVVISPPVVDITAAGQAPTPRIAVDPPLVSVTTGAQAPTPVVSVSAPVSDVQVVAQTPTVVADRTIAPPVAEITITGLAPTVSVPGAVTSRGSGVEPIHIVMPIDARVRPRMARIALAAHAPALDVTEPDYEEELLLIALAA